MPASDLVLWVPAAQEQLVCQFYTSLAICISLVQSAPTVDSLCPAHQGRVRRSLVGWVEVDRADRLLECVAHHFVDRYLLPQSL